MEALIDAGLSVLILAIRLNRFFTIALPQRVMPQPLRARWQPRSEAGPWAVREHHRNARLPAQERLGCLPGLQRERASIDGWSGGTGEASPVEPGAVKITVTLEVGFLLADHVGGPVTRLTGRAFDGDTTQAQRQVLANVNFRDSASVPWLWV